jgi:hypothetical protein
VGQTTTNPICSLPILKTETGCRLGARSTLSLELRSRGSVGVFDEDPPHPKARCGRGDRRREVQNAAALLALARSTSHPIKWVGSSACQPKIQLSDP